MISFPVNIPARVIAEFLCAASASHGDIDVDIEIIEAMVHGWSDGGRKESLALLATRLGEMASRLDHQHGLGLGFESVDGNEPL